LCLLFLLNIPSTFPPALPPSLSPFLLHSFPNGESGLDVYTRVTSFISTMFRYVHEQAGTEGGREGAREGLEDGRKG